MFDMVVEHICHNITYLPLGQIFHSWTYFSLPCATPFSREHWLTHLHDFFNIGCFSLCPQVVHGHLLLTSFFPFPIGHPQHFFN
jgi:hypothetical protein